MNPSEFEDAYDDALHIRGQILETPISQFTLHEPVLVDAAATVDEAVRAMNTHSTGCVLVQKGGRFVGIFTERDVVKKVFGRDDNHSVPVETVMTKNAETLEPGDSIAFALNHMSVGGYRHIPIVENGKPVGVLSVRDIVNFLADLFPDGTLNLPPNPKSGIYRTVDGG